MSNVEGGHDCVESCPWANEPAGEERRLRLLEYPAISMTLSSWTRIAWNLSRSAALPVGRPPQSNHVGAGA